MKGMLTHVVVLVMTAHFGLAQAQTPGCDVAAEGIVVTVGDKSTTLPVAVAARNCLLMDGRVYVAAGAEGVVVYSLADDSLVRVSGWRPATGEVLQVEQTPQGLVAVLGHLAMVPLQLRQDGSLGQVELVSFLSGESLSVATLAPKRSEKVPEGDAAIPEKPAVAKISGRVLEVRPEVAVLDVGSDAGVVEGDRFELRAQELKKKYNLASGTDEMLPSNEVTGVVKVVSVTPDKCLVRLGRGDRATVGDLAVPTSSALTGDSWFPGYERNLNRIQAKIGPFLGIDTLSAGMVASVKYDRTFSFPMRVEAGVSNVGFVFGEDFAAPFHVNAVPSYDTDYFEVGLGLGYAYSNHERRRGMTFLQKVRLGTVDGLNLTVHNSFVYQKARENAWYDDYYYNGNYNEAPKVGEACTAGTSDEEKTGHEFNWEGIDATLSVPITSRVTLVTDWSYAEAGWFYGDIGIRTLVMGNGGHGTLIIPVTIGGVMVTDYVASGTETYCDADSRKWDTYNNFDSNNYGGPVVTIGIDYRWR
jgi:hypothetical protein